MKELRDCFRQVPEHEYHAEKEHLSSTAIKDYLRGTPSTWYAKHIEDSLPRSKSRDLAIGSLTHCLTLEPGESQKKFLVLPVKQSPAPTSQKGKDALEELLAEETKERGLRPIAVTIQEWEHAEAMAEALRATGDTAEWVAREGISEAVSYWKDVFSSDVACKCRCDRVCGDVDDPVILELKTTKVTTRDEFIDKEVPGYMYHVSAAHYCEGVQQATGSVPGFLFGCVCKSPPYDTWVWPITPQALYLGTQQRRWAIDRLQEHEKNGDWRPAFSHTPSKRDLPKWVYDQWNREHRADGYATN